MIMLMSTRLVVVTIINQHDWWRVISKTISSMTTMEPPSLGRPGLGMPIADSACEAAEDLTARLSC